MLNPFELLAKLPTPSEVLAGLMDVPKVLSDKDVLASHVSYRLAQVVALAVRQMSEQELWVGESAAPHYNRIVDVVLPIMSVNHTLRWKIAPHEILSVQRVEAEPDANTFTVSPANVTLTVLPSVYEVLEGLPFELNLDLPLIMEHVHISGQPALAEWVNRLAKNLRPDVWAQLADVVGVTPAGWMQQGFYRAKSDAQLMVGKLKTRCLDGEDNHAALLLRHAHLNELGGAIQGARAQVDALAARVASLVSRSQKASS